MNIEVLGISGSPTKNSNTDRLVKAILDETGAKSEFVKLSTINVRPCRACYKCVNDNICKQKDDFPALAEKIKTAKAIVIGGYTPYSQIDGYTKALLERFWSFRHQKNLLKGKLGATVLTVLCPKSWPQSTSRWQMRCSNTKTWSFSARYRSLGISSVPSAARVTIVR